MKLNLVLEDGEHTFKVELDPEAISKLYPNETADPKTAAGNLLMACRILFDHAEQVTG